MSKLICRIDDYPVLVKLLNEVEERQKRYTERMKFLKEREKELRKEVSDDSDTYWKEVKAEMQRNGLNIPAHIHYDEDVRCFREISDDDAADMTIGKLLKSMAIKLE